MSCEAGPEVKKKSNRKCGHMKCKNALEYGGNGWFMYLSYLLKTLKFILAQE